MAQISQGTRTLDWNTEQSVTFDSFTGRKDRAYLYYINSPANAAASANQYVNLIAIYSTEFGIYEMELQAKYFPKVRGFMFVVAIPDGSYDRDVALAIEATPKEFYSGTAAEKQISIELLRDDDELRDVVNPT